MADRIYEVFSPEYVVGGYGYEPPEPARDWALIEAPNARAAKWRAHRHWQKHERHTYWEGDTHPLSGITAVRFEHLDEEFDLTEWMPHGG